MRVLLAIPHVFAPKEGSLYSSQTEAKRELKTQALRHATLNNLARHQCASWIHASLGKAKPVITRELISNCCVDLHIQVYTPSSASLAAEISSTEKLKIIDPGISDFTAVPSVAARRALEQAADYDLVGYMEDDILIEDREFFHKLTWLVSQSSVQYAFLPHRCESIPERGDVILSGDPDGGRPDLFWGTGEQLTFNWSTGKRHFYRATNPHSGCFFLTQQQALILRNHWHSRAWVADFQLSGPLEQAASGMLLPVFKVMKPVPADYRFLMVKHMDELWKRHPLENP